MRLYLKMVLAILSAVFLLFVFAVVLDVFKTHGTGGQGTTMVVTVTNP